MNVNAHIRARLAGVPPKPGVYLMRDAGGRVIYVGKAILLRNRLRSYFQKSASHTPKTQRLVGDVADLEWVVTSSELEALILECEFIKRYRPRYNVRFKDDKRYPFIKITIQEDFPRVYVVRKMGRDGARYFGPFTSAHTVHESLETLRRLFPLLRYQALPRALHRPRGPKRVSGHD
jgi:excinuclease ABC subunit C